MDKATEIIQILQRKIFPTSDMNRYSVEELANLIRLHLAPEIKAQFVAFEVSDDEQTTMITFKAKMQDVIPLRMGLGFDYRLAITGGTP